MAMKPRAIFVLAALALVAIGVSATTIFAADPPAQATKPTGTIKIVPVPANAADPNAIIGTLADGKTKVAMGTTGLPNVSVGVPVTLQGLTTDPAVKVTKYAWTLTKPTASKAALTSNNEPTVKFTPDVPGVYKVDLVLSNDAGSSPMASIKIQAGEYIGVAAGNCAQCHPQETKEWSQTGHAVIFQREINGGADPATSHYNEGCVRCHTTGYYIGVKNGGFADLQAQTGWQFPALADIQTGKGQWEAVPEVLKAVANIQCEDCHGPAKDHVTKGAPMASSLDEGVCNVCHNGGGHHIKGAEFVNSAHSDATAEAWTHPVGPEEQACVRCHSGKGYISFLANPTEQSSWNNEAQTVSCAVCHEPHSAELRVVGKPVEAAGVTKDFGLSATCVECHNGRKVPADAQKGGYPHYSTAGEMLSDTGGVTYGQTVPNSPHGMMVGVAPMKDPSDPSGNTMLFGGQTPGACVACHMYPTPADAKDPGHFTVGEHSFNMTSPDGKAENTAACQSCHAGVTSFEFQAKADYDGNGKVETVQAEVAGLLKLLQGAIADSGIKPIQGNPYFDPAALASANEKQKNAIYNYRFVRGPEGADGKAAAVHNFKRSVALLQLSYKDLTGKDVPNATLITAAAPAPATAAPVEAPAPSAQPVAAPAAAGGAPSTPHALQGREQCTMCHTVGGPGVGMAGGTGMPASHQGRTDATCVGCH